MPKTGCELDPLFETDEKSVIIPVGVLSMLPACLEPTRVGDPKGSLMQYRCVHGYHVREYAFFFEVHRDAYDPRIHPVAHLVLDTKIGSVVVFSAVAVSLLRRAVEKRRNSS